MRAVQRNLLLAVVFGAGASAQSMTEAAAAAAGGTVGGAAGKKVSDGVTAIFGKVDKQAADAAGNAKAAKAKSAPPSGKADASKPALIEAGPGTPDFEGFVPPGAPKAAAPKPKAKEKTAAVTPPKPAEAPPQGWVDVPPPPPLEHHGTTTTVASRPAPASASTPRTAAARAPVALAAPPPPPLPPAPPVTLEDLQKIENGMTREDVLKIAQPSARITMFENGGLLEIFSYHTHDKAYGDQSLGMIRLNDGTVSGILLR